MKKYTINMLKKDIKALKNESLNDFLKNEILAITDYRGYIAIEEASSGHPIFSIEMNDYTEKEEFKAWVNDEIETQRTIEEALNYAVSAYISDELNNFDIDEEIDEYVSYQIYNCLSVDEIKDVIGDPKKYLETLYISYENVGNHSFNFYELDEETKSIMIELTREEAIEALESKTDE